MVDPLASCAAEQKPTERKQPNQATVICHRLVGRHRENLGYGAVGAAQVGAHLQGSYDGPEVQKGRKAVPLERSDQEAVTKIVLEASLLVRRSRRVVKKEIEAVVAPLKRRDQDRKAQKNLANEAVRPVRLVVEKRIEVAVDLPKR